MPSGSGLLFLAADKAEGMRRQIWFQPYPAGAPVKVTHDLSYYGALSVTADGKSFITTQERPSSTIYVAEVPAVLGSKIDWKFAPISSEQAAGINLSWMESGKLAQRDASLHLYLIHDDGSHRTRLLESDSLVFAPSRCGFGNTLIASRIMEDNAPNLWRLDAATGALKQLTHSIDIEKGSCTPDGKWVVYNDGAGTNQGTIFKMPVEGGAPVELARGTSFSPVVSPDGKIIAYGKTEGQGSSTRWKIVLQKLDDGTIVEDTMEPVSDWVRLAWAPDGRGLTVVRDTTPGVQNLYLIPLKGGKEVQLTHFDSEPGLIPAYDWSPDGKKLAITRARYDDSDVVMFNGLR
jgi:Tol biopolymer transport system component